MAVSDFSGRAHTIKEERRFTNPHVRFRRIKGRIVPIINKKRIGQDVENIGIKTFKAGAAVSVGAGAVSLLKRTKAGKKVSSAAEKAAKWAEKKAAGKYPKTRRHYRSSYSKGSRMAAKLAKGGYRGTKTALRHSGKIGLALMLGGAATKLLGDEIQMRSRFGKDYAFIKDPGYDK